MKRLKIDEKIPQKIDLFLTDFSKEIIEKRKAS